MDENKTTEENIESYIHFFQQRSPGIRVEPPDTKAIPGSVREFGGDALTATFMPRKPLENERKAWQAYSAGQTIGLPMLPFPTPSAACCQAYRGINAFVLSISSILVSRFSVDKCNFDIDLDLRPPTHQNKAESRCNQVPWRLSGIAQYAKIPYSMGFSGKGNER